MMEKIIPADIKINDIITFDYVLEDYFGRVDNMKVLRILHTYGRNVYLKDYGNEVYNINEIVQESLYRSKS